MLLKIQGHWTNIPDEVLANKMLNKEIKRLSKLKDFEDWIENKRNKRKRRKK